MTDTLIVYGARCVWWDDISKAAKLVGVPGEHALPCCPHCHSVLYQMEPAEWFEGLDRYEREGHPGYIKQWEWMRGRCFPNLEAATAAYKLHLARSL